MYIVTEKVLLAGDFNAETQEEGFDSFLYRYELENLVKEKTCFKNVSNASCIDLFLISNALSFQYTETVSTGLSDFHKLVEVNLEKQTNGNSLQKL